MSETIKKFEALQRALKPLVKSYDLMLDSQREAMEVINNADTEASDYAEMVRKYNFIFYLTESQFTVLKPQITSIVNQMKLLVK